MCNLTTSAYTPQNIGSIKFRIPLYQRPYAWEPVQVEQLLKDLRAQFINCSSQNYYIGILNVGGTEDTNLYELIDGQQRITTLILIGKVFEEYHANWKDFLNDRLDLYGRNEDMLFLEKSDSSKSPNPKMIEAVAVVKKFMDNEEIHNRENFSRYVFEKAAFFISEVPEHYSLMDKNMQFVRMNNRGKQLESHDVLKIKMASKIVDTEKRNDFIKKWNKISQLGCSNFDETITEEKCLNEIIKNDHRVKEPPKETEIFYQSIVSFPEFLLIALERFFNKENSGFIVSHSKGKDNEGYRKDKLLEEFGFGEKKFDFVWTEEKVCGFMKVLESQFDLYDRFIIKRDKEEKYKFNEKHKEKLTGDTLTELQVFQSYIYVTNAPSQHNWLVETFDYLKDEHEDNVSTCNFLLKLKDIDNKRYKKIDPESFKYPAIDRYWFWRLDYYLWESREKEGLFTTEIKQIADNYYFRGNRSIEHLAPQSPKSNSIVQLEENLMHAFGNLVMISAGQNSSLKNESYEVKKAHVKSFVNGDERGTIESLKMLHIYQYDTWNDVNLKKHANEMIDILLNSFSDEFSEIKNNLEKQKYPILNE